MSLLQLLFAVLLALGNGFFVGAEFALVSVRRSQIEPLAAAGSARARTVLYGLEHLPRMMAAAQFGITVCSLTLGAVAEPTVARLLEPVFHTVRLPQALVHPLGYVIALVAVVLLHLVIGEMLPKNLALAAPERTALRLGPGLVAFARLCHPVTVALGACSHLVLRLFGVEPKDEVEAVFTSEQLTHLVRDSRRAGLLDHEAHQRLADALELGSRPVTDVLLDPAGLVTVGPDATPREVEELTVRTGYSRFPVRVPDTPPGPAGRSTSPGSTASAGYLGYLHVKDVLELEDRDRAVPPHLWRPMTALRADLPLDDALSALRAAATHLAAVVGESGQVLGLVTLEDVLEKLVGEVRDPAHRTAVRSTRPVQRTAPASSAGPAASSGPGASAGSEASAPGRTSVSAAAP